MRDTGLGCFLESEIADLPGVGLNVDPENWLVLQRLRESQSPLPTETLGEWIDGRPDDPHKPPSFKPIIVREVDIEEASDLCEADLLHIEDCHAISQDQENIEAAPSNRVKIVLRIERLAAIRAGLEEWRQGAWNSWAREERPVRKSIRLYNELFKLHNMLHGGAAATPPELVWGIGLARWQHAQDTIDMPLIEQLVDLDVLEQGALVIRPRDVAPNVVMKPFMHLDVEGSAATQRKVQALFATITEGQDEDVSPYQPEVWEGLLDLVASLLQGRHITREHLRDGEKVKSPEKDLAVYSSWAIYGRARSENAREQDLERLRSKIDKTEDDDALPKSMLGYVTTAPNKPVDDGDDWGLTRTNLGDIASGWDDSAHGVRQGERGATEKNRERQAYFFPLPYNEEQAKIIDRLETDDVVTVTGPPGTGKTHSIANIIGHFMATGQRVLVTARTAEAIAAVRDKLPQELARLVIASVASDREGVKQLEDAIQRLSDDVVSLDANQTRDEIKRLEAEILEIDAASRTCDQRLKEIAEQNLAPLSWDGEQHSAMDMAETIAALEPAHAWMTDRPSAVPPAGMDEIIERLRIALPQMSDDLVYLGACVPQATDLPTAAELIDAHKRECKHRTRPIEDFSNEPPMARDTADAEALANACYAVLDLFFKRLEGAEHWELSFASAQMRATLNRWAPPATTTVIETVWSLIKDRTPGQITYETGGEDISTLIDAAARGCAGKPPVTRISKIFKGGLVATIESIRLDGVYPQGKDHWALVYEALKIDEARPRIESHWNPETAATRLPPLPATPHELLAAVKAARASIGSLTALIEDMPATLDQLKRLFPCDIDLDTCLANLEIGRLLRALRANMKDAYVQPVALGKLEVIAAAGQQPLYWAIQRLHAAIGIESTSETNIVKGRTAITEEIIRVRGLHEDLAQIGRDLLVLRDAGAHNWADMCLASPLEAKQLLPVNWRNSWDWAVMRGRLDRIIALGNGDECREKKTDLARRREQRFEHLIRARTLLGLKPRLQGSVLSALATFTAAIRRLGKGTGKSAGRWRKAIRQAAMEAAPAAPVWVMPEHKIAEQLPAILGDFNLVILDEASQSDVTAIAALARGKKHLIVGDEQQVSPTPVGIPQSKIDVLRAEHLNGLPNRNVIDEKTSIFDIAMQMYPKSHVMLREHFRCVEPIIQFSTRFYSGRLIPIRVPKPSERFDPPLVDVLVKGAKRKGKINEDEARFIVDEIATIACDPAHAKRDVAVISLIGGEQAELIQRRLMEDPRVGTETMERMRIVCGDSRTMQGQERSIVFLSMVATPGTAVLQGTREDGQRFNVALSRARDRLYVVHSVSRAELKSGDLKLAVLDHFADPMPAGGAYTGTSVLDRCESGFEREVCGRLIEANYRVRAQVRAGPFSIDLVVEGADDRRLAIELDGDRWHGPDKWDQDMARQAVLERAGWTFWRVFGSQWISDRAYWWDNLVERLGVMGITPIGALTSDDIFTEYRVFDVSLGSEDHPGASKIPASAAKDSEANTNELGKVDLGETERDATTTEQHAGRDGTPEAGADYVVQADGNIDVFVLESEALVPITRIALQRTLDLEPTDIGPNLDAHGEQSNSQVDASRFYDQSYRQILQSITWEIIDREGPVTTKYLCERVARLHGFQRTGSEIKRTIQAVLKGTRTQTHETGDDGVVWPKDRAASEWIPFRGLDINGETRSWADVPIPEKLGLARQILAQQSSEPETTMRETLGLARLRTSTRLEIEALLEKARADLASGLSQQFPDKNTTFKNSNLQIASECFTRVSAPPL